MLVYRILVAFLRFTTEIFFRRVEVVGLQNVPPEGEGPVIFAGNHPNSLLDPLLITVSCRRVVHFAAKDVLFRTRIMRWLLGQMGAVAVRRRSDHGGDAVSNDDAFEKLFDVLGQGRAMGIFPEGLSHDRSQLARLKTGAARIAFGAATRHRDLTLRIVPTGLHYVRRNRFRTSVLVQFGPPIVLDDARLQAHAADPRAAVVALTDDIDQGIRGLTVNAPDWETLRLLDGVRRLYQPPDIPLAAKVELARRFSEHYPDVADDPGVIALLARVGAYQERLDALGLADCELLAGLRPSQLLGRIIVHTLLLLLWLPLALIAAPVHAPLGLLLRVASHRVAPRKDVVATTKFFLGLGLVGLVYLALTLHVWLSFGLPWALLTVLLLPLSGYATIVVVRRFDAIDRKLNLLFGTYTLGRQMAQLTAERTALSASIVQAVHRLRPPDLELLYPDGPNTPEAPEPHALSDPHLAPEPHTP